MASTMASSSFLSTAISAENHRAPRSTSPRMLRIVLGGEDFEDFTSPLADNHIKLYVPGEGAISKLASSWPLGPAPASAELETSTSRTPSTFQSLRKLRGRNP